MILPSSRRCTVAFTAKRVKNEIGTLLLDVDSGLGTDLDVDLEMIDDAILTVKEG